MPGVHELDVSLSPAFIKLIQENKNIPFISITGVKFDKCQVKSKIYGTNYCVLYFYVLLKHLKFKWRSYLVTHLWSHIYNALGVHTITCLNTCKIPAKHTIVTHMFYICRSVHHQGQKFCKGLINIKVLLFVVYWVSKYWVFAKTLSVKWRSVWSDKDSGKIKD